ncbi:hypothetical protein [Lederbergia panacisoli]|uniref:hypothetical protein n=1 Tax=Lederbergia panacisoli TaxID=1255251 RepID=UPI00214CC4E7|nr:hypothetical protein [Lederbergia panacisoli]MCR2823540.1 hypothetical protein [Lederbergia panacisoli]
MKNLLLLNIVFVLAASLLTGCYDNVMNLVDGDQQVSEEMNQVISDYIVEQYAPSYYHTEKQFEVHKVYGTSESNGVITVYMWSYFGGFNKSSGIESRAGHSLPAVIRIKKDGENYKVSKYKEPQDGSSYSSSLKKMFPEKYLKLAQQDAGNLGELQIKMDQKVMEWLGQ